MRIIKEKISDIEFVYTKYESTLYQSVKRIGLSFPIKIQKTKEGNICVDGNKRLSVLKDMQGDTSITIDTEYIHCIVVNDGSNRSNDCWRQRNTH